MLINSKMVNEKMKQKEEVTESIMEMDPIQDIKDSLENIELFSSISSEPQNDQEDKKKNRLLLKRKNRVKQQGTRAFLWLQEKAKIYEQQINEACLLIKYVTLYNVGDIVQMALYMKEIYSIESINQDLFIDDVEHVSFAKVH